MKRKFKSVCILAFLLITCVNSSLLSQVRTISGNVVSKEEGPLVGANVSVKGTMIGTITDKNGNYTIYVPNEFTALIVSFIGYQKQEVPIDDRTIVNIELLSEIIDLSEIAVIGYGSQKRKDLTGAVSTISQEQISRASLNSIDQTMQGMKPGVMITNDSGEPGSGVSIKIRGIGTINNSEPLYVIDGVPITNNPNSEITTTGGNGKTSNPLANINPNDIESIDILKDASAAAIYGVRGANGVVVITTKRGKQGKPVISFESYTKIENVGKIDLLKARDYADLMIEMYENAGQPLEAGVGEGPYNLLDPAKVVDRSDWQDAFFKTGITQNYYLNVSGGAEKVDYNLSGGYYKNTGTCVGAGMDRYSFQINSNYHLGKVTIGESVSLSRVKNRRNTFLAARSPLRTLAEMAPTVSVFNDDNVGGYGGPAEGDGFGRWNPVGLADLTEHYVYRNRLIGSIFAEWEIFKNLKYKLNLGADISLTDGDNFIHSYYFSDGQEVKYPTLKNYNSNEISPLIENTLTYSKVINNHNLTLLGGYTQQSYQFNQFSAYASALQSDFKQTLNTARPDGDISITGVQDAWAIRSYLGRFIYGYNNKYLLTTSIRRDGSSRFSPEHQWGIFPSFSVGWRLSEESFMKSLSFINDLKIRAGYGQIGNQEVPPYGFESSMITYAYYSFGGILQPGVTQTSLGYQGLQWEITKQTNIGLDASLFGDRTLLTIDYFIKNTDKMIIQAPVPGTVGIDVDNSPFINAGQIENRGLELALEHRKKEGAFRYDVSANVTFLNNNVKSLGLGNPIEGRFPDSDGAVLTITEKGYPIGSFLGYVTDGIFQTQQEIDDHATQPFAEPGDIRFKDLNDDEVIDSKDRKILGNPIPKLAYGFSVSADFKGFDLLIFFQGVSGLSIYNGLRYWTEGMAEVTNHDITVLNRWTNKGTSNTIPRAVYGDPNFNRRPSDRFLENGSYLRLKNISLGYSIPSRVIGTISKNSISGIRIYVTGQNLLTFTEYTGYDPEIGTGFNQGAGVANQGVDYGIQPQPRTYMGGIRITF